MNRSKVAAIVPAYNEEETVAQVVYSLRECSVIDEIVVVSDGSTDGTKREALLAGADHVLDLPIQKGKGRAMMHGVAHTDASILLFTDADLTGFDCEHAEKLLLPVMSGSRMMNVGVIRRHPSVDWILPHLPLISGERAMHRHVIESLPSEYLEGYMVEAALNYLCRINGWSYGTVLLGGVDLRRKYDKVSLQKAALQYILMTFEVCKAMVLIRFAGLFGRLRKE